MKFSDIPQLPTAHYRIDVAWNYLETWLTSWSEYHLNLEPDFQRAHVWLEDQQVRYVEWILQGGESGRDIYFNHPNWARGDMGEGELVLVDGKQRLQAVRDFMSGKVKAFGHYRTDYSDIPRITTASFSVRVASLATRADVLTWYLKINAGGTPHTKRELDKVRALLEQERK